MRYREVVEKKGDVPLTYNPQADEYRQNTTKEVYIRCRNPAHFLEIRNKTPKLVSSDFLWETLPRKKYREKRQVCVCSKEELMPSLEGKTKSSKTEKEFETLGMDDVRL